MKTTGVDVMGPHLLADLRPFRAHVETTPGSWDRSNTCSERIDNPSPPLPWSGGPGPRHSGTEGGGRMDLDLRLVRYFVAVADELHFGRAAARLYVSQPALSKQIRKLEDQIGEPLLVRNSRHVALTARGERFHEDARELLA